MDEALELADFLPISYKTKAEQDYVAFLWDAFESNYISGKYEFASFAFHLLYMSFVSCSLWQIRLIRERDFRHALIGFQIESENQLMDAESPFRFFDKLKESQVFRFLKLIGCVNEQVGEYAKFVKRRNKIAHPSGTVFFNDQESIDAEISSMMREVASIQKHMSPVVTEIYERFLNEGANPEERVCSSSEEEIEVNLVHRYYFSRKDLEFCFHCDLTSLKEHEFSGDILMLHALVIDKYGTDDVYDIDWKVGQSSIS